jgi:hypothetical protein
MTISKGRSWLTYLPHPSRKQQLDSPQPPSPSPQIQPEDDKVPHTMPLLRARSYLDEVGAR